jgi:hypothetical protein
MEKMRVKKKPSICHNCGSKKIATILYGLPAYTSKLETGFAAGEIILGGCCVTEDDPLWECSSCHNEFWKIYSN